MYRLFYERVGDSLDNLYKGIKMNKVMEAIELLSQGNDNGELNSDLLLAAKQELEWAYKELESKRNAFQYEMELKQKSLDSQIKLFNMKWSLLEEETRKLAEESKKEGPSLRELILSRKVEMTATILFMVKCSLRALLLRRLLRRDIRI